MKAVVAAALVVLSPPPPVCLPRAQILLAAGSEYNAARDAGRSGHAASLQKIIDRGEAGTLEEAHPLLEAHADREGGHAPISASGGDTALVDKVLPLPSLPVLSCAFSPRLDGEDDRTARRRRRGRGARSVCSSTSPSCRRSASTRRTRPAATPSPSPPPPTSPPPPPPPQ